jgi:hypothetical protein
MVLPVLVGISRRDRDNAAAAARICGLAVEEQKLGSLPLAFFSSSISTFFFFPPSSAAL